MTKMLWSVELESTGYTDDTFNGTYDECVGYCRENDYHQDEARMAQIEVDEDNSVVFWHEIIEDWEDYDYER